MPKYRFALQPYEVADYAEMSRYHQTSPESHFTLKTHLLASNRDRARLVKRNVFYCKNLKTANGKSAVLENQEEYAAALHEPFGAILTNYVTRIDYD